MIDFYSPTCRPCTAFSRTIRHVSRQYKNRVAFGKLDVTKGRELARRYKVMSVPYTVIFSYGKKVYTLMGKKSEKELAEVLGRMLDKYSDRGR